LDTKWPIWYVNITSHDSSVYSSDTRV